MPKNRIGSAPKPSNAALAEPTSKPSANTVSPATHAPPTAAKAALSPAQSPDSFVYVSGSTVTPTDTKHEEAFWFAPHVYMRMVGPMGRRGPIGMYGPLGTAGPVGSWAWNPSRYITGTLGWEDPQKALTKDGGPLSKDGPLGEHGPLGEMMDATVSNPYQPGGMYAVLGPWGVLGALGPLGPLGPVGAHGFSSTKQGDYVDKDGNVQRTIRTQWSLTEAKDWDLVEDYSEKRARELPDNDTSFLVEGSIARTELSDTYRFRSKVDQYVSVLVLPELATAACFPHLRFRGAEEAAQKAMANPFAAAQEMWTAGLKAYDDFDVEILNGEGKVVARSNLLGGADWIHIKVPADTELQARVKLRNSLHPSDKPYRLFVVGSNSATVDPAALPTPWEVIDKKTE
ncbi:MAG: hypothetical protein HY901_35435 [Deltaproteobacteria bacterium]|nr:hypothetical protein [Deltaproteobacteria bacterium]